MPSKVVSGLIEHLATEPAVPKQADARDKTADQLLQDLYERNPNFACTASLRVLAADLGFASLECTRGDTLLQKCVEGKERRGKGNHQSSQAGRKKNSGGHALC